MAATQRVDVAIVGGGIIGLAVAWRARERGMSVALLERDELGRGASHVAAGMLAPVAEVEFGEAARGSLQLGLCSARSWPRFTGELGEAAGVELALRTNGTLIVARDEDESRELERQHELRRSLGLRVSRLRPSEARELEPALAPTVRRALECPEDHSVDPREVLFALRLACERAGVGIRERTPVASLLCDASGAHVTGVLTSDGVRVGAGTVVLAAGAWSEQLAASLGPTATSVPVRPVKGQILRLRDPAGAGLLGRAVRYEGGYLLPRGDGRYVLGATVEERGFELRATAGGVYELLRDARELVPGVSELEIEEVSVGLRPGSPDNAPVIGPARGIEGLIWASGHHRNGILLAPLSAELVLGLLDPGAARDEHGPLLAACDPGRFAETAAPGAPAAARGSLAGARA
jgi:glycine oxidase